MDLSAGIDYIGAQCAQKFYTSFGSDIDLKADSIAILGGMAGRPPRHWIVTSAGAGTKTLTYKDHFGNTIALDITNLVGATLPAGSVILHTTTDIGGLLVIW